MHMYMYVSLHINSKTLPYTHTHIHAHIYIHIKAYYQSMERTYATHFHSNDVTPIHLGVFSGGSNVTTLILAIISVDITY